MDVPDSQLMDRALAALIEQVEADQERAALERHPYDEDPELGWDAPALPSLAYQGEVPADVRALAERRRRG